MAASNSALLRFAAACRVHRLQDAMAVLFDVWVAARERGVETRQIMMRGNIKGATHSMRSALIGGLLWLLMSFSRRTKPQRWPLHVRAWS